MKHKYCIIFAGENFPFPKFLTGVGLFEQFDICKAMKTELTSISSSECK